MMFCFLITDNSWFILFQKTTRVVTKVTVAGECILVL